MKSSTETSINNSLSLSQEKEISFSVQGMTCASCVRNVERAIKKIDGVKYVSVNLATEKAIVIANDKVWYKNISKKVEKYFSNDLLYIAFRVIYIHDKRIHASLLRRI